MEFICFMHGYMMLVWDHAGSCILYGLQMSVLFIMASLDKKHVLHQGDNCLKKWQ